MDMSWQALLQEAAATSLEKTADTLAAAENDNCACVDFHQQQIHELSKKILLPVSYTHLEGFTEDGNLVTRDLLYDKATNKQFITVQTLSLIHI